MLFASVSFLCLWACDDNAWALALACGKLLTNMASPHSERVEIMEDLALA